MNFDVTVLGMFKHRESWNKIKGAIPRSGLEQATKNAVARIGEYFRQFPDVTSIEKDPFLAWLFGTVLVSATPELKAIWNNILNNMDKPVDPTVAEGMFDKLLELGTASIISDKLAEYTEGEDIDIIHEVEHLLNRHKANRKLRLEVPIVDGNVLDLMDNQEKLLGIKWRNPVINMHMRPMIGGDFIGVAARPDRGKTSFITDNASYFAPQVQEVFGEGHPVMWLCNEGSPRKIWLRMYQSTFNMTMSELSVYRREVCKSNDTKFLDNFYEKLGGQENLLILDAHKMSNVEVEDIVSKYSPSIMIYDMIDNLNFGGIGMHGGTRTDQMLESMYQWARELAVATNHIAIATSQISGDGEGLAYPTMQMLKDSKTGKQGTFDTLMMIGASNSNGMQDMRYIGTPKNKLRVDGSPSNMQVECIFDGSRGRFNAGKVSSYRDEPEDVPEAKRDVPAPKPASTTASTTSKVKRDPIDDI